MDGAGTASPENLIELEGVTVRYGRTVALENVSLRVQRGDLLGVIGPNGGGKTTLLKVVLGLLRPAAGKVLVMGRAPNSRRQQVGYVPQHSRFDPSFPATVLDVVLMGRLGSAGLFRNFRTEDRAAAVEALEKVGLADLTSRGIGQLSGGQRQRVYIARALAMQTPLMLLDEPMSHVDSVMEAELYALIDKLRGETTVVFVSHDVGVISSFANKIACLNKNLFFHDSRELTQEMIDQAYCCPVDMIAHGVPHRVLKEHGHQHHDHGGEEG